MPVRLRFEELEFVGWGRRGFGCGVALDLGPGGGQGVVGACQARSGRLTDGVETVGERPTGVTVPAGFGQQGAGGSLQGADSSLAVLAQEPSAWSDRHCASGDHTASRRQASGLRIRRLRLE